MARKFEGQKGVDFQVMDITNLTFPEQLFDVVFDKGALDALYLGGDGKTKVKVAVPGIYRVLRPGGILVADEENLARDFVQEANDNTDKRGTIADLLNLENMNGA